MADYDEWIYSCFWLLPCAVSFGVLSGRLLERLKHEHAVMQQQSVRQQLRRLQWRVGVVSSGLDTASARLHFLAADVAHLQHGVAAVRQGVVHLTDTVHNIQHHLAAGQGQQGQGQQGQGLQGQGLQA